LSKIITVDETLCFQYHPESNDKACNENTQHPHDPRKLAFLITFFNIIRFIPQGQTVNQGYYVEILKRLREGVCIKRSELWSNDWILHHDNAPAHKALSVKQFLAKKSITEMEHLPYSPDLAPNDSGCFDK
jgi:hypothetical protein